MTAVGRRWEELWAPHRMANILATQQEPQEAGSAGPDSGGPAAAACVFCRIPQGSDADGLVVARGDGVYAVLNLYPYNPGHLMVVPYRHIADYTELDEAELVEFTAFTRRAMVVLREVSHPAGFNVGINAGQAGGAGIAAHLHQHVVPRWDGDANFMTVLGGTRVLPALLADTREMLSQAW